LTGCRHFLTLFKRIYRGELRGEWQVHGANLECGAATIQVASRVADACSASAVHAQGINVPTDSSYKLSVTILEFGLPETVRYRT
jgi:hypothetical protein